MGMSVRQRIRGNIEWGWSDQVIKDKIRDLHPNTRLTESEIDELLVEEGRRYNILKLTRALYFGYAPAYAIRDRVKDVFGTQDAVDIAQKEIENLVSNKKTRRDDDHLMEPGTHNIPALLERFQTRIDHKDLIAIIYTLAGSRYVWSAMHSLGRNPEKCL